ncbi:TraB/GumN family protein [bacterium]|nr:TraB/GumN family protein [bacterium]
MLKTKYPKWIIWLFLVLLILGGCSTKGQLTREPGPLLWKIDGDKPTYLFGTIHLPDPRVTELPESVTRVFDEASAYVMEVDLGDVNMAELGTLMLLPDGKTLSDLMTPELYQQVSDILTEKGQDIMMFESLKPWVLFSLIALPPDAGDPMDQMLYKKAQEMEKETGGLETIKEQIVVFDGLSLEEQIIMLEQSVNEYEQFEVVLEKMIELYLRGDVEALTRFMNQELVEEDYQDFYDNLITRRNYVMASRMEKFIRQGNVFVAVGAGHLGGSEGVIKLLQDKGYKLTQVR